MTDQHINFPPGFLFGAATAAYQVEGAFDVDGRGASIWDTFCRVPGAIMNGDNGDRAAEQYTRYPEDIALMRSLNLGAYRFSISWPRVQPTGAGPVNKPGLDYYDRLVDALLAAGIAPWATLYHWDLPQALQDDGGWPARATAERYADYVAIVADRLGDRVASWSTFNEPWCSSFLAYSTGEHAPGHRDHAEALRAVHHLLLAHGLGVQALRAAPVTGLVGIVTNLWPVWPGSDSPEDLAAGQRVDRGDNRQFLDPLLKGHYPEGLLEEEVSLHVDPATYILDGDMATIAQPIDYLGVNYYNPQRVAHDEATADEPHWPGRAGTKALGFDSEATGMGWEVSPEGLGELLRRVKRDYGDIPLYITENGASYHDDDLLTADGAVHDAKRVEYLRTHLIAVADAAADGVDVRGYFAWSLLDNFEWAWGYSRRFGITYVDFVTQQRIVKDSGHLYAAIAASGQVPAHSLTR